MKLPIAASCGVNPKKEFNMVNEKKRIYIAGERRPHKTDSQYQEKGTRRDAELINNKFALRGIEKISLPQEDSE